jgi:hypothetical protein
VAELQVESGWVPDTTRVEELDGRTDRAQGAARPLPAGVGPMGTAAALDPAARSGRWCCCWRRWSASRAGRCSDAPASGPRALDALSYGSCWNA